MEKINVAELLRDCPRGMELDCVLFDDVKFEECTVDCIYIRLNNGGLFVLTKYGNCLEFNNSKCIIFPKGKTTWKGFHRPFKDGDIIHVCDEYSDATFNYVAILKQIEKGGKIHSHCFYNYEDDYFKTHDFLYDGYNTRFATEEEKEKLFQLIKENGYKWNLETKTLEKLIEPKFKVGDKVKIESGSIFKIKEITDSYYVTTTSWKLYISYQDGWKLVPNKFDINTLKSFDKVLVRLTNDCVWSPKFFFYYDTDPKMKCYPFVTTDNIGYPQCIPYNGNEHLCRKTNNCDEFYRVWEK